MCVGDGRGGVRGMCVGGEISVCVGDGRGDVCVCVCVGRDKCVCVGDGRGGVRGMCVCVCRGYVCGG